jgi:hypothetical protein
VCHLAPGHRPACVHVSAITSHIIKIFPPRHPIDLFPCCHCKAKRYLTPPPPRYFSPTVKRFSLLTIHHFCFQSPCFAFIILVNFPFIPFFFFVSSFLFLCHLFSFSLSSPFLSLFCSPKLYRLTWGGGYLRFLPFQNILKIEVYESVLLLCTVLKTRYISMVICCKNKFILA